MGHENIWNAHPKTYGPGSRTCRVCGNPHGLIRKYGLMCCRQCFRSNAKEIGFIKFWSDIVNFIIMKLSGLCLVYLVVGTAIMFLANSDPVLSDPRRSVSLPMKMRKIKESGHIADKKRNDHKVKLDDYSPIDPVPSSKASIKPGPIVHGTPLNPFIPNPSPPSPGHPKNGGVV